MNKKILNGIVAGTAIVASVALTYWDYANTVYECHECGGMHKPTVGAYCLGMHTINKRLLKCPYCGSRNWHYRTVAR